MTTGTELVKEVREGKNKEMIMNQQLKLLVKNEV
jgi:hypothetical protein